MWVGGVEHYLGKGDVAELLVREWAGKVDGKPAWSMLDISNQWKERPFHVVAVDYISTMVGEGEEGRVLDE